MTNYNDQTTDLYMRSVLSDELHAYEVDNALTTLSSLTSLFPGLFPADRTYVRSDHETVHMRPSGVRFVVYSDTGIVRQIRLPRALLGDVATAIDAAGVLVSGILYDS